MGTRVKDGALETGRVDRSYGALRARRPANRRRRWWPFVVVALALAAVVGAVTAPRRADVRLAQGLPVAAPERAALPALVPDLPRGSAPAAVAAAVSLAAFPDGTQNVVLARDTPSADALAAGGLQGLFDAPLLLTDPAALTAETAAEIDRLGVPEIHILGGAAAVSVQVEEALNRSGHHTHRHAGETGVETAVSVAAKHFPDATSAILIPSAGDAAEEAFADTLSAAGLAAARKAPVLLSGASELSPATRQHLAASAVEQITVIGDSDAFADGVIDQLRALGIDVVRLAGADRFGTAVAVAQQGPGGQGSDAVLLADGASAWPGASVSAVQAGRSGATILLADGVALHPQTRTQLLASDLTADRLVCTPGVAPEACAEARDLLAAG